MRRFCLCLAFAACSALLLAQAPTAPVIRQTFTDANGLVLNGGKICTYAAGTTTPIATYSDDLLTVPQLNPITLLANGQVPLPWYWSAVSYKIVLLTAASTTTDCVTGTMSAIWTQDNIIGLNTLILPATLGTGSGLPWFFLNGTSNFFPLQSIQVVSTSGTVNNTVLTLTGQNYLVKMSNATDAVLTGICGGIAGSTLDIESIGAGQVDLAHLNAGSSATCQFSNIVTSGYTSLAPGTGWARYRFTGSHWRLEAHEQGAWITPAFSAGNFAASSAGTWTVGSAVTDAYYLRGTTLDVALTLALTSVGQSGAQPVELVIGDGAYGGYTVAAEWIAPVLYIDNGSAITAGYLLAAGPASAFLGLSKLSGAQWAAAASTTSVYVNTSFQVQ